MTDEEVLTQLSQMWSKLGDHPSKVDVEKLKEETKATLCQYEQSGTLNK